MVLIVKLAYRAIAKLDDTYRDRRSENYAILGSPTAVVSLTLAYYIFVKHLGPQLMEHRKPFELKKFILVYNLLQILINSYLFVRATYAMFWEFPDQPIVCRMPDMTYSPKGVVELHNAWIYTILKFFDYMDTIFMVLRKRNRQVSFLHVYHHIMVGLGTFVGFRYIPGGHGNIFGIINALVHALMYSYYFVSVLRPEVKHSLWWKKQITHAQILQFLFLAVHFARPLVEKSCDYPKFPTTVALTQCFTMLVLFGDFYRRTYFKRSSE